MLGSRIWKRFGRRTNRRGSLTSKLCSRQRRLIRREVPRLRMPPRSDDAGKKKPKSWKWLKIKGWWKTKKATGWFNRTQKGYLQRCRTDGTDCSGRDCAGIIPQGIATDCEGWNCDYHSTVFDARRPKWLPDAKHCTILHVRLLVPSLSRKKTAWQRPTNVFRTRCT